MIDRIRHYIERTPEAISGQCGHVTTLRVARTLFNGFGLSRDEVLAWLRIYNARLSEKWSDRELAHKADSAECGRYDKPRGWMLQRQQKPPREVVIRIPKSANFSVKSTKKYLLATDATDIPHASCM